MFVNGFDMTTARSAVDVQGILNDPYVGSTRWSVEVALPINMLVGHLCVIGMRGDLSVLIQ